MTARVKQETIKSMPSLQLLEKQLKEAQRSLTWDKWFKRVVVVVSFLFIFGLGGYSYYRGKQINAEIEQRSKSIGEQMDKLGEEMDKLCEEMQESVVAAGKRLEREEAALQKLISRCFAGFTSV